MEKLLRNKDEDIVSTPRERLGKFIRELRGVAIRVKILTDSTIISFDAWYRFILDKVYNIDMPIKHQKRDMVDVIKADEWGDKPLREMVTYVEPKFDYNFYTDEVIELERLIEPCSLIPQDNLKYAIINIIAYVCSDLVVDYLAEYCKLTGSYEEGTKCRMVIKSSHPIMVTWWDKLCELLGNAKAA